MYILVHTNTYIGRHKGGMGGGHKATNHLVSSFCGYPTLILQLRPIIPSFIIIIYI